MEETKLSQKDGVPKPGKVHEMCREWLVREDGAFAYQLQSQEINDHYKHNKHKNAQVREDFPCALDEQLREQKLAEQAAAVYQKMLAEQEEIDNLVAKELAEKIDREERAKRRVLEQQDAGIARHLLVKEISKSEIMQSEPDHHSPQKPNLPPKLPEKYTSPHRPDSNNYFANLPPNLPRRHALPMPLPNSIGDYKDEYMTPEDCIELYTEPYRSPEVLVDKFNRIDIQEIGVPIDEVVERRIQEERDAELARQLQEEEGNSDEVLQNRDRLLAIEAQDKELAKLLQERERAKAKRSRERAKQKALAKKQQEVTDQQKQDINQLMPDDSYAFPVDVIQHRTQNSYPAQNYTFPINNPMYLEEHQEDDINYSFPLDVISTRESYNIGMKQNLSPQKGYESRYSHDRVNSSPNNSFCNFEVGKLTNDAPQPARPTQLELRSPLTRQTKPRFPDPESYDDSSNSATSPSQLVNIAMAIDPTYPRKGYQTPPSFDTTSSSTVTTSTSGSSPCITLPPPDISENEGDSSPVPPYMPIQGQRRTSSLEKKQKKKNKDGCRQQ